MSWLSEKMTAQQRYVWERRADVDLRLAGGSRVFRLSEAPGARFAAVLVFLDWLDTFGDGAPRRRSTYARPARGGEDFNDAL